MLAGSPSMATTGRGRDEMSKRLCAVLGHELRNPLASAMTNVSVAVAMMDGDDPRATQLQSALGDLDRLSKLLTTYLEFGCDRATPLEELDLVDVIRAVASRAPDVSVTIDAASMPVRGDAELLSRAVENIIENAFCAGAHRVRLVATESDGAAILEISDDGPGVPEAMRSTLFDPFVSGRGSSGLGLAVAREAIAKFGGQIELMPRTRRGGATFRVLMPLRNAVASRV